MWQPIVNKQRAEEKSEIGRVVRGGISLNQQFSCVSCRNNEPISGGTASSSAVGRLGDIVFAGIPHRFTICDTPSHKKRFSLSEICTEENADRLFARSCMVGAPATLLCAMSGAALPILYVGGKIPAALGFSLFIVSFCFSIAVRVVEPLCPGFRAACGRFLRGEGADEYRSKFLALRHAGDQSYAALLVKQQQRKLDYHTVSQAIEASEAVLEYLRGHKEALSMPGIVSDSLDAQELKQIRCSASERVKLLKRKVFVALNSSPAGRI